MMGIRELVLKYNLTVLSDEVYEHLTYDEAEHIPFSTLPDMWDVTFTLSSTGKTFSFTGWKIGWGYGPAHFGFREPYGLIIFNLLFWHNRHKLPWRMRFIIIRKIIFRS